MELASTLLSSPKRLMKSRCGARSKSGQRFTKILRTTAAGRELLKDAHHLLMTAQYPAESWLRRSLPKGRRWTRAMNLIREADPDSLAPLEHQLDSLNCFHIEGRHKVVEGHTLTVFTAE